MLIFLFKVATALPFGINVPHCTEFRLTEVYIFYFTQLGYIIYMYVYVQTKIQSVLTRTVPNVVYTTKNAVSHTSHSLETNLTSSNFIPFSERATTVRVVWYFLPPR